jgi:hypothetical protein
VIDRHLRESADAWFPDTPSLDTVVAARLPALPDAPRRRVSPRVLAIALAVIGLTGTAVAATALDVVPGVRIQRAEELPAVPYIVLPFGREVSLREARASARFPIRLPEQLGAPDWIRLDRDRGGAPVVTAVYGDIEEARLVLTQWVADSILFDKLLGYEAHTELLDVDGASAIWIEGGDEHAVFYDGASVKDERVGGYLSGNALVWQRGLVSYRLEAGVTRDRALELARSLVPVE